MCDKQSIFSGEQSINSRFGVVNTADARSINSRYFRPEFDRGSTAFLP